MTNLALPLLVVVVLPVLWLLHRVGLIRRGPPLWIAGAVAGAALVAVVATTSRSGMDLVHLKRVQFLLAAATSSMRVCLSGIRRSRHWDDRTPSSDSARSSQLPCLGV